MNRNRLSRYIEDALYGRKFCSVNAEGVIVFGPGGDGRLPPEQRYVSMRSMPYQITAAVTLNHSDHAGRTGVFNILAGVAVTLPKAFGTGGVFRFVIGLKSTSLTNVIKVGNTTDVMQGPVFGLQDGGDTVEGWECAAGSDTFTMDASTTGGLLGDWVEFEDIMPGIWAVRAGITQTGTQATPYSSAV